VAYGCAGSSPAFRTILKGNNDAKLLFPCAFSDLETLFAGFLGIPLVYPYRIYRKEITKVSADRYNYNQAREA
jgi:hypothetical protein